MYESEETELAVVFGRRLGETALVKQSLGGYDDELRWTPGGGSRTGQYALFTRRGFAPSVTEAAAERDDLRLFTVDDVVEAVDGEPAAAP